VEHAHARQARFADLARADEVEAAVRREPHRLLAMLAHPEAPAAGRKQVAAIAALAEMAAGVGVADEAGRGEMRIAGAQPSTSFQSAGPSGGDAAQPGK
jgi:hypothetical protein